MTLLEACELAGRTVLHTSGGEPGEVVITGVDGGLVLVRRPGAPDSSADLAVLPGDLAPVPDGADPVAASQASLNEFAATVIRAARWDAVQAEAALSALREHNWAAGFDFEGVGPAPTGSTREHHAAMAASHVRSLQVARAWERRRAELEARPPVGGPAEAADLLRRSAPGSPSLVYVITHAALGAAKIGVSDPAGARIAQHRRVGWQLIAAFQVAADAAAAIEADVLGWWRGHLGLPPYLSRGQMPQDGWTETVAAARIDLAATVAHVCELAMAAESRPTAEVKTLAGH
jgi:hypothetical protein